MVWARRITLLLSKETKEGGNQRLFRQGVGGVQKEHSAPDGARLTGERETAVVGRFPNSRGE